ncbi:MAG: hypothetical protein PHV55_04155 [Candidatus Omnitrophica bacterium]|nr:hypothetical protein [Candidatus Omnitrophota bacterium]
MKRTVSLILIFFLFSFHSYAFEWKELHANADAKSLIEALEAVAQNPASAGHLYVLGLVYLNMHQDDRAQDAFTAIQQLHPENIEAQWGLAEILRRKHQLPRSEALLKDIIKENPRFAPAYISLAYLKYTTMQFNESAALANKVIAHGKDSVDRSNYARAYLILAGARGMIAHYGGPLAKISQGTRVFGTLKKAQKITPTASGVYFGLGSFYLLAPFFAGGDIDKAQMYLQKTIETDPYLAEAYVRLAQVYKIKHNEERYRFFINKALAVDPGNEVALDIQSGRCKFICIE